MKIHIFGTAASEGWPAVFCNCEACVKARALGGKNIRSRAGSLVNNTVKLDFGPDTQMQALRDNVDLSQLRHFVFTHSHVDHFAPHEFLFYQEPFAWNHPSELTIYGNETIIEKATSGIRQLQNGTTFEFRQLVPFESFQIEGLVFTPLLADHDKRETCLIYLIEEGSTAVLWGHDTGFLPEETWSWLLRWASEGHRLSAAFLDCTSGDSHDLHGHMGLHADVLVKQRLLDEHIAEGDTQFIITHFSHNVRLTHEELEELAKPHGFRVAYDGMDLTI